MDSQNDYNNIPNPPEEVKANTILIRMIDGLIFRFKWATEGLFEEDLSFRPCESSMNMMELLNHIHQLTNMIHSTFERHPYQGLTKLDSLDVLRSNIMGKLIASRNILENLTEEDLIDLKISSTKYPDGYPFWNLINGPIADALTHIGQITSWRRINGNPIKKVNVFLGRGPKS